MGQKSSSLERGVPKRGSPATNICSSQGRGESERLTGSRRKAACESLQTDTRFPAGTGIALSAETDGGQEPGSLCCAGSGRVGQDSLESCPPLDQRQSRAAQHPQRLHSSDFKLPSPSDLLGQHPHFTGREGGSRGESDSPKATLMIQKSWLQNVPVSSLPDSLPQIPAISPCFDTPGTPVPAQHPVLQLTPHTIKTS